ncbi:MAG: hypothetical protein Q7T33_06340 [Dehalococcoidia bacterium]|nr:hypothetical protein [Dehalococcoidia bacterium]
MANAPFAPGLALALERYGLRWAPAGLALTLLVAACSGAGTPGPDGATGPAGTASPAVLPTGTATQVVTPALSPLPEGATITVDGAGDDDSRDDLLTLREAILLATGTLERGSLTAGEADNVRGDVGGALADVITFDASAFPQEGGEPITLASALPSLSSGFDAVDGVGATPVISGGPFECLRIDSGGNTVRGLMIRDCDTGLALSAGAQDNVVGGAGKGQGNVISGNRVGIEIRGRGNRVEGNLIGLDASGRTAMPNRAEGIWIAPGAQDNIIGGGEPGTGNVISGNDLFGVSIDGPEGIGLGPTRGNVLAGNYIGTDTTGMVAVPNEYGINIQAGAQENVIGGEGGGKVNVIAGNQVGIVIRDPPTQGNVISGNYFGLTADGAGSLPNGVDVSLLEDAGENVVRENVTEPLP